MRKGSAVAASALALGAFAVPANAEDAADWTGVYVGGSLGLLSADNDWEGDDSDLIGGGEGGFGIIPVSGSFSETLGGFGVHAGYQHQLGPVVLGAEAGYTLANFNEEHHFDGAEGVDVKSEMHGYGTVNGLVGYAVGNLLCFATGGVALADLEHSWNDNGGFPETDLSKKTVKDTVGWNAGAGVEYLVAPNVSVRVVGEYLSFGEKSGSVTNEFGFETDTFEAETAFAVGTVSLNYRF